MKFFFSFVGASPLSDVRCLYTPVVTDNRTTLILLGRPPPYLGSRVIVSLDSGLFLWYCLTVQLRNSGRPPPHSVLGSWLGFEPGSLRVFDNTLTMCKRFDFA